MKNLRQDARHDTTATRRVIVEPLLPNDDDVLQARQSRLIHRDRDNQTICSMQMLRKVFLVL